jgi:hypothetical protein
MPVNLTAQLSEALKQETRFLFEKTGFCIFETRDK